MKNNANKITYLFIFISLVFAVISLIAYRLSQKTENYFVFYFIINIIFIIIIALLFRTLIVKNNKVNIQVVQQQKKVNQEIRQAKERYDIVAKATSDTVWDWKFKDNIFTWNKGIQTMFGYKKADVQNTSKWWFERIHPEDSIRMSVKLYSFIEQKTQKWQDEYRFKCKDGTYKYVLDRGFLVINDNGTPTRMIGAMQDITNKKIEEERLKLLETVVINTVDAVLIMSSELKENNTPEIIFANQAFCKMSGYSIEQTIGNPLEKFLDWSYSEANNETILRKIKHKQEFEIETIGITQDNQKYWLKFSMVPVLNSEKEITHWISIQRDISQQKNQEKEKEQLIVELTQNNKDLRQFSYITSHNLRAPLSNLIGLLQIIKNKNIEDEELKAIIEGFSKSTLMLNETIVDLGKVVIIRDNPSIIKENLSLSKILDSVKDQIEYFVNKEDVKIEVNFQNTDNIFANKAYLESIMLNLLSNSLKYKKASEVVNINIALKDHDNYTELIFEDNGIGIDLNKFKDKIFGLYQRFHDYPDSKGLGLYLVKSQIESMGGTIAVKSEVNQGTRFTIKFKKNK